MSSAFFDAALYIFIIEWTPAFQRTLKGDDPNALPYGMIFSLLMVKIYILFEKYQVLFVIIGIWDDWYICFRITCSSDSSSILYDVLVFVIYLFLEYE